MSPHQLSVEIENAFDNRDRDAFARHLARLVLLAELHRKSWQGVIEAMPPPPAPMEPSE